MADKKGDMQPDWVVPLDRPVTIGGSFPLDQFERLVKEGWNVEVQDGKAVITGQTVVQGSASGHDVSSNPRQK